MAEEKKQFIGDVIKKKKGEKYNESEFIEFLESLGLKDIQVGDSGEYRRFNAKHPIIHNDKEIIADRTVFVAFDSNYTINKVAFIVYKVDSMDQHYSNNFGGILFLIGAAAIVITIGYFIVTAIMETFSDTEDVDYEYIDDSNDYDYDGDVDYDDVDKYLEDSLKEDVNDGDDW